MSTLHVFRFTIAAIAGIGVLAVAPDLAKADHNGLHTTTDCNEVDTVGGGQLGNSPGPIVVASSLGWDVGSGQCNGSFTVTQDTSFPSDNGGGIELGLRAEERRVGQVTNNSGDYEVQTGHDTTAPEATNRAWWNFHTSVAYDGNIFDLDSLQLIIRTDAGPNQPAANAFDLLEVFNQDIDFACGGFVCRIAAGSYTRRDLIDDRHGTDFADTAATPPAGIDFILERFSGSPTLNPTSTFADLYQISQNPVFGVFDLGKDWLSDNTDEFDMDAEGAWTFKLVAVEGGSFTDVTACIHTPNAVCLSPFVVYSCDGFDPPMDKTVRVKKKNRVLPLKMVCVDGVGNELTDADIDAPVVQVVKNGNVTGETDPDDVYLSSGKGDDGNEFVYDNTIGLWQFNLSTKNFTGPGNYEISVAPGGSDVLIGSPTATFIISP